MTDFKNAMKQKTYWHSTFSLLDKMYHPFLFLAWRRRNKLKNRNPGVNHTADTLLYLGDTCVMNLEGRHWVSCSGTRALCPLDLSLDPDEPVILTLIFIWNAPSLHVLYFWLVELVSAQDVSWLPTEYSVKIDKAHCALEKASFYFSCGCQKLLLDSLVIYWEMLYLTHQIFRKQYL